uniref:Uncharacterized protein n=1 Tax=Erythrolobus madagascarensis TaxID=708628 RepID=A0A6T9YYK3_9RHOD
MAETEGVVNGGGEGVVRRASTSMASAARGVYEQKVKPSPVVERASESYEQFKKTYPTAGETLEQAERAVSSAVAAAAQQGEHLVDDIDNRIHKQYETRLKKPIESVTETVRSAETAVRSEADREEVKAVRDSGVQMWESLVALLVMYATRVLTVLHNVLDSKLPSITSETSAEKQSESEPEKQALSAQVLGLLVKFWNRMYTRLAAKANMEPREIVLADKNIEDKAMALLYLVLVIKLGVLMYFSEYASCYNGVAGPAVRASAAVVKTAIDTARPILPGQLKPGSPASEPAMGETVGVFPSEY